MINYLYKRKVRVRVGAKITLETVKRVEHAPDVYQFTEMEGILREIFIRYLITPKAKSKYLNSHLSCWRGGGALEPGIFHIFWKCPKTAGFWEHSPKD